MDRLRRCSLRGDRCHGDNHDHDSPALSGFTTTVGSNGEAAFDASDFTSHFIGNGDGLATVKITTTPLHGDLELGTTTVTPGQEIAEENLGELSYHAHSGDAYTDLFFWKGSDGVAYTAGDAAVTLNYVPVVSGFAKAVPTQQALTFALNDFSDHFADPGDSLQTVKITVLPAHGQLTFGGTAVTVGQEIASADVGGLTYVAGTGSASTDSFSWNASDGMAYAMTAATTTIAITPAATGFTKTIDGNGAADFSSSDFTACFSGLSDDLQTVKITAVPGHGELCLFGAEVEINQEIATAELNDLTYQADSNSVGLDAFAWTGSDGSSYACSDAIVTLAGTSSYGIIATADSIMLVAKNSPMQLHLGDNGSPNSTQTLALVVVTPPQHGTLAGFDAATGDAWYTPATDYGGDDSFAFQLVDTTTGSLSSEATVSLSVVTRPVAHPQDVTMAGGTLVSVDIVGSDGGSGQPLTYAIANQPAHGA